MTGRSKRIVTVICLILFVACIAAMTLSCTRRETLPDAIPVPWEAYLREASKRLAETLRLNGDRINLTFTADFSRADKPYKLFAGMNYDVTAYDESELVMELSDEERKLMSIVCDNDSAYIDIVPNDYVGDAKLLVTDTDIFDWLGVAYNPENEEALTQALADIFVKAGTGLFGGVNVNAEGTVYTFTFAPDCFARGTEYFEAVFDVLGESFENIFLKALRADSIEDFFASLPSVKGGVVFDFSVGNSVRVYSDGLTVDGSPSEATLALTAGYDFDPTLSERFPSDPAGYVSVKLGNTRMTGTVRLRDSGLSLIKYDFELNSNIDLLTLILNDYDFSALSRDNYFHFRLKHVCDGSCGDFCAEKTGAASGAVLDIGFSPEDFGTDYIYVSLNLNAFVSSAFLEKLSDYAGASLALFFPDYALFAIPSETIDSGSVHEILVDLLRPDRLFFSGDIDIPVSQGIPDPLYDISEEAAPWLKQFFAGESYDVDEIIVEIDDNLFGEALTYDVYKQTVYIIDDAVSEVKDYGNDMPILGYKYVAPVSWEYEPERSSADGSLSLNNIYDKYGNVIHGIDREGRYVPMSPEEAEGLTSMYLKASYLSYDKVTEEEFDARIVDVYGLDPDSREVQEVTVKVEYPGPFGSSGAGELFSDMRSAFAMSVKVKIKLCDFSGEGTEFRQDIDGKKFYLTRSETTPPAFLVADVTLNYAGGYSKSLEITGTSEAVVVVDNIFSMNYSVVETGDIDVRFDVANMVYRRTYHIERPDRVTFSIDTAEIGPFNAGKSVYVSSFTPHIKMTASYDLSGGPDSVDVLLSAGDFRINGIPLSRSSSDWTSRAISDSGSYVITFRKASEYLCYIDKFGYKSDAFVIPVLQAETGSPQYAYRQVSATPSYWFTGVDYSITGQIVNSLHGETPDGSSLFDIEVRIEKAILTDNSAVGGSSYIRYECVETTDGEGHTLFCTTSDPEPYAGIYLLRCAGSSVSGNRIEASVPDMITAPVTLNFSLRFASTGYYRIKLTGRSASSNTFTKTWEIYVGSL